MGRERRGYRAKRKQNEEERKGWKEFKKEVDLTKEIKF